MAAFNFKGIVAQEDALEKTIANTKDPKKKAELEKKRLKLEAMVRAAGKAARANKK